MRSFVAGATGALGKRLVPLIGKAGHYVIGATRSADKVSALRAQGADPVVVDGLDKSAVLNAVAMARPDVVIHQMTALTTMRSLKNFDDEFELTNRLRVEGTEYLLEAAR